MTTARRPRVGRGAEGVRVRPPRPEDANALAALHNLVWRHAYAGLMPQEHLEGRDDVAAAERWAATIDGLDGRGRADDGRCTLVAVAEPLGAVATDAGRAEQVIGFVTAGPARRDEHRGMAELMALYVHPDRHGSGVAQALVEAVDLPNAAMLWVLAGNARAMRFYAKLGFERRDDVLVHEPTGTRERLMVRPG